MLLHIGAFHLPLATQPQTPWHRLMPRTRVLCVLLLVFAIGLTPDGRWLTWACYGMGLLTMIWLSRVALMPLCQRVSAELLFISTVLLGTLFRDGGEVLWQWGWLRITTAGLVVLGSVGLKATLSLLALNFLTATTSIPALLNALLELRFPPLLVAILASMSRYLTVLVEETKSMQRAAQSRNLMNHPRHKRLIVGNMFGSLFLRTLDRGERVHQAMLARGYQGAPPVAITPVGSSADGVVLTLTAGLTLLGQIWGAH
jgi:cobalt/nickel transport system permease protein